MSVRLFVGNLAHEATEAELRELFSKAGRPTFVRLPTDRETGAPRGFAFVEYAERSQAEEAIRTLDRQLFKGRPLSVSEARPKASVAPARQPATSYAGPPGEEPAPEWTPPKRSFGPDAPTRGKRKPERRSENREGVPKGRSRPDSRRPAFEEQDGPDDFDLWKAADLDEDE